MIDWLMIMFANVCKRQCSLCDHLQFDETLLKRIDLNWFGIFFLSLLTLLLLLSHMALPERALHERARSCHDFADSDRRCVVYLRGDLAASDISPVVSSALLCQKHQRASVFPLLFSHTCHAVSPFAPSTLCFLSPQLHFCFFFLTSFPPHSNPHCMQTSQLHQRAAKNPLPSLVLLLGLVQPCS